MNDNKDQQPPRAGRALRNYKNQRLTRNNQNTPMQSGPAPSSPPPPGQFEPAGASSPQAGKPYAQTSTSPSANGWTQAPGAQQFQGAQPPQSHAGNVPPSGNVPSHWGSSAHSQTPPAQYPGQPPMQGQAGQQGNLVERQPFANAMQHIRGFTDKIATIAGHSVQPPAPMMERYRPQPVQRNAAQRPAQVGTFNPQKRSLPAKIVKRRHKRRGPKRVLMTIGLVILVLITSTAFAGTAYGYTIYQQQLPQMQKYAKQQIPQMTRIYDRNNVLLYQAYTNSPAIGGRRVDVTYQDIPQVMQDAMTSIEDRTFWTNDGFDVTSIIRAASSGVGGGSTITQQLVKNLSGDKQATLQRKVNEAAMAVGLTQQFSKSTILTMYLNTVPFGSQDYGIEIAAQDYFGLQSQCKPAQPCTPAISLLNYNQQTKQNDPILGLARASLLAGIPNAPYTYDPTIATHRQAALHRQDVVLKAMQSNNIKIGGQPITNKMIQEAEALTAKMKFQRLTNVKRAPNFVDYVIGQVETALGNGDPNQGVQAFVTGGYNIRTTVDVNLNDYAQNAIQRHLYQPEIQKGPEAACGQPVTLSNPINGYYCDGNAMPANVQNGAVVVQDVKNGEILAMVGSADYNTNTPEVSGQFNAATSPRQPGSTFKLFDYATAFQMGWNPGITLADTMTAFPNGAQAGASVPPTETEAVDNASAYPEIYPPSDYGAKWWNFMESITWATANSMNVPAVRAMQYTGPQAVKALAERLGITFSSNQNFGYATAIGSAVVSPLQMVNAYATFGNGGVRVPPQTILDIWNNNGQSLYHYNESNPPGTKVISPQIAYEMTSVLANEPARNFEFSGDHDLSFADVDPNCANNPVCGTQLAAKTGTTDNFTDNWTIGYTPNVAVAVWVGNNNNSSLINSIGITGAAPIFHSVIERALGWCNYSYTTLANPNNPYAAPDQVPCGKGGNYNFPFSGHPQLTFTNPGGLTQGIPAGLPADGTSTTSYSRLPGGGAARIDWMLSGN